MLILISQEQIPDDQDPYEDCNVAYEGAVIPVIMQELRRSKENIDRGKVSFVVGYMSDAFSLFVKKWNSRSALHSRSHRIGKKKRLQTRKSSVWLWLMLRLVEVCRRLNILNDNGVVRAVPVMGRMGNEVVYGSIVSLTAECY